MSAVTEAPEKTPEEEPDPSKVLDLVSLAPNRTLVKLPTKKCPEGELYELRFIDDFGLEEQQRVLSYSRQFDALFNQDHVDEEGDPRELTAEEQARMTFCLDQVFDAVLDAPKSVKRDIPSPMRRRVMMAFSYGPVIREQQEQLAREKKEKEEKVKDKEEKAQATKSRKAKAESLTSES